MRIRETRSTMTRNDLCWLSINRCKWSVVRPWKTACFFHFRSRLLHAAPTLLYLFLCKAVLDTNARLKNAPARVERKLYRILEGQISRAPRLDLTRQKRSQSRHQVLLKTATFTCFLFFRLPGFFVGKTVSTRNLCREKGEMNIHLSSRKETSFRLFRFLFCVCVPKLDNGFLVRLTILEWRFPRFSSWIGNKERIFAFGQLFL